MPPSRTGSRHRTKSNAGEDNDQNTTQTVTQQTPESVEDSHTEPQPTTSKEDQLARMFEALCRRQDDMTNALKDLKTGKEELKEELKTSQDNLKLELRKELQGLDRRIHVIQTQLCTQIDQLNT